MQTVESVMRKIAEANPDKEPEQLIRLVKAEIEESDWDSFIVDKLKDFQREVNHRREMSAFRMFAQSQGEVSGVTQESLERLRSVFNTPFRLGDGFMTTWGDATAEQHEARIALLQKQIDGLSATQGRHREAIRLIEAAGVTCLNELGEVRKAA